MGEQKVLRDGSLKGLNLWQRYKLGQSNQKGSQATILGFPPVLIESCLFC